MKNNSYKILIIDFLTQVFIRHRDENIHKKMEVFSKTFCIYIYICVCVCVCACPVCVCIYK